MEAAIILPLIVLTTITIILIIMFFFTQMTESSRLHIALREDAGRRTGQTEYIGTDIDSDVNIEFDKSISGGTVYGRKNLIMDHKGILYKKGVFAVKGSSYVVDGTEYVRYCRLIKGIVYE